MIEVRYAMLDGGVQEFDEIVAGDDVQAVHLEKMGSTEFSLIIETRRERVIFSIGTKRAPVDAREVSRDPINRRSEAQRRRWSRLAGAQRRRRRLR